MKETVAERQRQNGDRNTAAGGEIVVKAEIAAETEAAETEVAEIREISTKVKTVATEYIVINTVTNKNLCERINAEA